MIAGSVDASGMNDVNWPLVLAGEVGPHKPPAPVGARVHHLISMDVGRGEPTMQVDLDLTVVDNKVVEEVGCSIHLSQFRMKHPKWPAYSLLAVKACG